MNDTYTIFMKESFDINDEKINEVVENLIHPLANVGANVRMGKGNYIGPFCNIVGDTIIGDNNHFEGYCSVGTSPEHREYFEARKMKGVKIGNNNVFREFITINAGTTQNTELENEIWMLRNSHVGHDSLIRSEVTLSCNVLIGGHSIIGKWANMGLGSICHQFSVIGGGAMVGMGCIVTKQTPILPFMTYVGNPAKLLKENTHRSSKLSEIEVIEIKDRYETDITYSVGLKS